MKIFTSLKKLIIFLLITTVCINIFSSETNGFFTQTLEENQNIQSNYTEKTTQEESNSKPALHSLQKSIIPHAQKNIHITDTIFYPTLSRYIEEPIIFTKTVIHIYHYANLIGIIKIVI